MHTDRPTDRFFIRSFVPFLESETSHRKPNKSKLSSTEIGRVAVLHLIDFESVNERYPTHQRCAKQCDKSNNNITSNSKPQTTTTSREKENPKLIVRI